MKIKGSVPFSLKYANAMDISARDMDPQVTYAHCRDGYAETSPVGSFLPNAWGLYDMLGDAVQWVSDCSYDYSNEFPPNSSSAPVTVFDKKCLGKLKAVRGAGWDSIPSSVRLAFRSGDEPDSRRSYFGFRLAVDLTH